MFMDLRQTLLTLTRSSRHPVLSPRLSNRFQNIIRLTTDIPPCVHLVMSGRRVIARTVRWHESWKDARDEGLEAGC
jgi:hypothetical protein